MHRKNFIMSKVFLETYNSVSSTIPFKPMWKNGTGYLGGAVEGEHMPVIPTGLTVKCIDEFGRKLLITSITGQYGPMSGQQVSNVVIFERYTYVEGYIKGKKGVIVSNATSEMHAKYNFLSNGSISEEDFRKFHFC